MLEHIRAEREGIDMEEVLEITVDVNKAVWQKLKKLSQGLEDQSLADFILQVGEYILETIERKSVIFEINGETGNHEAIDFGDLLEQYCFDDMLKRARPDDFL